MKPHIFSTLFCEFVIILPHPFSTVATTSQLFAALLRPSQLFSIFTTQRSFTHSKLSHREAFTHRSFYTEKLLHTASFHTEKLLHREAFTQQAFTQRSFYTEKLLHSTLLHTASFFTQGKHLHTTSFHTQKLLHREALHTASFHTQKLLHTEAFTQSKLLHGEAFTQQALTSSTHNGYTNCSSKNGTKPKQKNDDFEALFKRNFIKGYKRKIISTKMEKFCCHCQSAIGNLNAATTIRFTNLSCKRQAQLQQWGTLTQPFHCDLQTRGCKTQ